MAEASAQQGRELRDGLGDNPRLGPQIEIPCRPRSLVRRLRHPGPEPLGPTVEVAHIRVGPVVVLTNIGQHLAGDREDRRDEYVLNLKAHHRRQPAVVVADRLHLLEQPQVTVVLAVGGALVGIGDNESVGPLVGRHLPGDHVGIGTVPARRVVHTGLPAVVERDQAVLVRVSGLGQPAVPAHQIVPPVVEEALGHRARRAAPSAGTVQDPLHGDCMHRRLGDTRGLPAGWGRGGQS